MIDRRAVERLSRSSNHFDAQGKHIWEAGVRSTYQGTSDNGWLGSPMARLHIPCMFEHMKKVNPEAADLAETQAADTSYMQNAQTACIEVQDSLPEVQGEAPTQASMLDPGVPTNKFKRSLPEPRAPKNPKAATKPSAGLPQPSPKSRRSPTESDFGDLGDSASAAGTEHDDESQFTFMHSRERLESLKQKLPLSALMNGAKLGRQERTVRMAVTSSTLDDGDKKLLRNHLKLAPNAIK